MRSIANLLLLASILSTPKVIADDSPPQQDSSLDSDGDGIPDHIEDENRDGIRNPRETNPFKSDTDGDGTSDYLEIKRGTDPNRNSLLSFPEPMVYDLVRGLDSEAGELELNVLGLIRHSTTGTQLLYAPEIEWAFADGHAIELELPFAGPHLEAIKAAAQGTIGLSETGDFAHGWQLLGEITPDGDHGLAALKWLGNIRLSPRVSLVSMFGARVEVDATATNWQALANVNLFYAVSQQVTLGLETNSAFNARGLDWLVMPQVHVQVNHHFRLQWGLGVVGTGAEPYVAGSFRGVVEL